MNEYIVTINGNKKNIAISDNSEVIVDESKRHYEVVELGNSKYVLRIDKSVYEISVQKLDAERYSLFINGKVIEAVVRTGLQEKASGLIERSSDYKHKIEIKAPMPGMILKIKKNAGESVKKGDSIVILEAMKMENDIKSPFSGVIADIKVKENNPVEKGAILFTVE